VHNLCWKLAAVLRGDAGEALLDSYEAERLPVGAANADWALHTFMNHAFIDAGIGLTPGAPIELNQAALGLYFADSVLGEAVRERTAVAIGTQASEFQAHGIELGYRYEDGALVPDGSAAPADDPFGRTYTPTTRPGHRLPHAWLQRDGARLSTHDLVRPGAFALIAGPQGGDWVRAARELSAGLGIEIEAVSVGDGGTCADVDGQWAEVCEVGADGAVLVRPDQHVGWRSPGLDADPAATLRSVLGTILAQPVQAPASA
jgi:2,4-dichlorophenol 6-monooxygenase